MRKFIAILAGLGIATIALGPAHATPCSGTDIAEYVTGDGECLAVATFLPADPGAATTLVVVLHGDLSRGGDADYIFPVAEQAAAAGQIGVAMMRLGYSGAGRKSTGTASRDENRSRIYTSDEMDAIAEATAALKAHYGVQDVAMVGHSGGAVMAGVILGRHPGLVQRALLLSCPCDVPTWRRDRGRNPFPNAESPDDYIDDIPAGTMIRLVTGSGDTNTRPKLGIAYAQDATAAGVDAVFTEVPGARHRLNSTLRNSEGFQSALRDVIGAR